MRLMGIAILVLLLSASLSTSADSILPEFRRPPFDEAFDRVYVQGEGIAGAAVHHTGEFSLQASATHPEDRAAIVAIWEIAWEYSGDNSNGNSNGTRVQAEFKLAHMSGADGLEWWGQLCCNAVATPYVVAPNGTREEGPSVRLSGTPVPRASEQILAALRLQEGRGWTAQGAWEAAEKLHLAPEEERGPALLGLLQALDRELALILILDGLTELGYLREQQVRFTFGLEEPGTYTIVLTIEAWACPQRPGTNIAWSLGWVQELQLTQP